MGRVLIVEDEWLQEENLETLLELRGHSICGAAATGELAVSLAKSERPDLVLMDLRLAGRIDGAETAERILAARQCQVIFVTAFDDAVSMARMDRVKPAAIIRKPIREHDLMDAVARALGVRRTPHQPSERD